MKSLLFRQAVLLAALVFACTQSLAADDEHRYPLSEQVYRSLSGVREMLDKEDYRQAESTLTGLLQKDINPYEQALINQMLGYIYNALDQRDLASAAFGKALADKQLPENVMHQLHYSSAQLLAQDEKYKDALDHLLIWFQTEKDPNPEAHALAAMIYYQVQDYQHLIPHMQAALSKAANPEQSWYELLLAAYYHTEDYVHAAEVLEQLISRYPDRREYWPQLAGMYQRANLPGKSLAIMELAHKRGVLDEAGIMQLVRLCLAEKLPQRAAVLLQEQMDKGAVPRNRDNLEMLAESWLLARESDPAAVAFTELATLTNDPTVYYRLGYIYFTQEKWDAASKALDIAVHSGALKDKPDAYLLLGISAYHTNEITGATRAFNQALNHDSTKQQAQWWLDKIKRVSVD